MPPITESPASSPRRACTDVQYTVGAEALLADLPALPARNDRKARELVLRQAWGIYIVSALITHGDLARHLGGSPAFYRRTFATFAAMPGAPALKPNGKL